MATLRELLRPFSRAIFAKASALRTLELTPHQRARLNEAVSDDVRKCTDLLVPHASTAALKQAKRLGISLNGMNWHNQPRFDKGRKIFHFEHIVPVSTIRAACLKAKSETGVAKILSSKARVVWILKTEDASLRRLGFTSNRPDPEVAYAKAKIRIAAAQQGAPGTTVLASLRSARPAA